MYYGKKVTTDFKPEKTEKKKPKQPLKRVAIKKKPCKIKPMSKKREAQNKVYLMLREKFLRDNPVCFIRGYNKKADTIEHTEGRGINFLKGSTWQPCCLVHNLELENNPELSKEYQRSKIHGGKKL